MSYGAQSKVAIARQAAANSWVTAAGSYHGIGFVSEDVGLEVEELISANLIGRFEEGAVYPGVSNVLGTIEVELTPKSVLALVGATLNHSATVTTSGSVRGWDFVPNVTDFSGTLVKSPWSIYKQWSDSNSAELFYDAQFGQLELTIAQGQFLRARATVAGGSRLLNGIGSADVGPLSSDVGRLFPWNVASISLGGNAIGDNSELTVTLNENIEPLYTNNGTLNPFKFSRSSFRQVTVNGTFYMSDRSMLNAFAAGTQQRLLVTLVNTRTVIQSGYFDTIVIDVPQFKITGFKPGASGPGELSVPFNGRGVIDPSSNYSFRMFLQNTYSAGL